MAPVRHLLHLANPLKAVLAARGYADTVAVSLMSSGHRLVTHWARKPLGEKERTMATMRFNHMELSFPVGTLTQEFRDDVDAFYCDVLGWNALDTEVIGQSCHLLRPDDGQFILLAEGKKPIAFCSEC